MIIKMVKWWKGEYIRSPSHSSNPIDFSNIFIFIKRTIYDMQIHDLVERSSTFIHVFRAQSISHADHFLLYEINQFSCNNGAMIESLRLKHYSQKWWLFVSHLNINLSVSVDEITKACFEPNSQMVSNQIFWHLFVVQ